jgi:type IV pilus assembly protein PilM
VVPDYAARMSVLDFEELPADAEQREALIRFRLRKSVPFSIDDARISATLQWHEPQSKRVEVLAAAISNHVLEEYESILTSKGYQVGMVVPSSVAALNLCSAAPNGFTIFAKLSGSVLSVLLLQGQMVRVVRCVDLSMEDASAGDDAAVISTLLHQTFAFVEDEYSEGVERFLLCGFGESTEELGKAFEAEFRVQWENLASRFGAVLPDNAGLLGLAEQYAA